MSSSISHCFHPSKTVLTSSKSHLYFCGVCCESLTKVVRAKVIDLVTERNQLRERLGKLGEEKRVENGYDEEGGVPLEMMSNKLREARER